MIIIGCLIINFLRGGGGTSSSSESDNQQRRATRAMAEPSPREEGDDGPPLAAGTQQPNIKSSSMARKVVATTVRVTTKAARAMGAGAMRTTKTRDMRETSPEEEGDNGPPPAARVHSNQILSLHQRRGKWWRGQ